MVVLKEIFLAASTAALLVCEEVDAKAESWENLSAVGNVQ